MFPAKCVGLKKSRALLKLANVATELIAFLNRPWHDLSMKSMAYCVYREEEYFVAQCLNVDVSSFGRTRDEAVAHLKEAVELYFQDQSPEHFTPVTDLEVGQETVSA